MYLVQSKVSLKGVNLPDDTNYVKTTYRSRVMRGEEEGEIIIRTEGKRLIGGIIYEYLIDRTYAVATGEITQSEIDSELKALPDLNDKIFEGFGDDNERAHKVN